MGGPSEIQRDRQNLPYFLKFKDVVDILEIIDNSLCKELKLELGKLKLTVERKR